MSDEHWMEEIANELSTQCPIVANILLKLLDGTCYPEKKVPATCLIYGIIMFLRCHELSRVQRINTVLLTQGQASNNLINRLNKYGFCLAPTQKYTILDEIGETFLNLAVELVKSGHQFVFVLDNIDWQETVHDVRKDNQNKMVHAVATSIVFDRIPVGDLSDSGPQKNLNVCNVCEIVSVSDDELASIRKRYRVLLAKILFEHCPEFQQFKQFVPQSTECLYSRETSKKSEVVTMPILLKDEKKYSDCVDVLEQLEEWTFQIYSAAGLCNTHPSPTLLPTSKNQTEFDTSTCPVQHQLNYNTPSTSSRPDQPLSHLPPISSNEDPLRRVKIPCFGDQLTRVRLAGAKDLRAGCHTARQRFDHIYPFCIVDWHTKRSFLKTIFKRLYNNSGREKGTIRYFREKLNRRKVTKDVKNYEDCEQLLISIGKSFFIEAFLEFFHMDDTTCKPARNAPNYACVITNKQKEKYITDTLDKFLDQFIFNVENEETSFSNDSMCCYSVNLIKSFIVVMKNLNHGLTFTRITF